MYKPVTSTNEAGINNYCADRDGITNTDLITWCKCTFGARMPYDHEYYCSRMCYLIFLETVSTFKYVHVYNYYCQTVIH